MGSKISKGKKINKSSSSDVKSSDSNAAKEQVIVKTETTETEIKEYKGDSAEPDITTIEKTKVEVIETKADGHVDIMKEEVVIINKTFAHQTGGHVGAFTHMDGGKIMKKVGKNEFKFYSEQLGKHNDIQPFAPTCYGTETKEDLNYIIIEDLTQRFKKPCILDIKMGTSSVGEDASAEKREAMHKKDMGTTTCSLGVRITAMKVYQHESADYVSYGKDWGKKVTADNFSENLKIFFNNGTEIRTSLIPAFIEKLQKVSDWINSQGGLRIYSSSLLFIYDGEGGDDVELKMIDFAHVHEITDGGKDEGYITGMKNLMQIMNTIN